MYLIPIPNELRLEFDFGYSIESTTFDPDWFKIISGFEVPYF